MTEANGPNASRANAGGAAARATDLARATAPRTDLAEAIARDVLPFVTNPAQYVGGEVNAACKDWDAVRVRLCLAFPDTYGIGMSHLGSAIVYDVINRRSDALCDRTYAPWLDGAERLSGLGLGLFGWESRRPVCEFDLLGFSLQYEMLATNVLAMLDLAGIPLLAAERGEADPLVLAGGPGPNNPEPMAAFFDLVVIGDAEAALPRFLDRFADLKAAGATRAEMVLALAREMDFVYAPGLLAPRWHPDGRLAAIEPTVEGLPEKTRAAVAADLESAPFPAAPVVPNAETVHDRLTIEIMRGCPRRCRFCEAGWTKGRVRLRSPERVLALAREAQARTGYDEISLASLSPSDHPDLKAILTTLDAEFGPKGVSLSLPSLRTNDQLQLVPRLLGSVRKSGLTMVPEAGLPRLRRVIGKDVEDAHLFEGARQAWSRGWNLIKLYFMIGLPTETDADLEAVGRLARKVSNLKRDVAKGRGRVNVAVANFVPKPHTPFQFHPMAGREYLHAARKRLHEFLKGKRLGVRIHKVERSLLEGALARGDRRLGRVILGAYRAGARFDAWDETFRPEAWQKGFEAAGLDPAFYAHRPRERDEVLPWDRVDVGAGRERLWQEYEQALAEG